jgi:hypothetical protein
VRRWEEEWEDDARRKEESGGGIELCKRKEVSELDGEEKEADLTEDREGPAEAGRRGGGLQWRGGRSAAAAEQADAS